MNRTLGLPVLLVSALCLSASAKAPDVLPAVRQQVQSALLRLDTDLEMTAGSLGKTGITGVDAGAVLDRFCAMQPGMIDVATVSPDGILQLVRPFAFKNLEGASIADQPQVELIRKTRKPEMSRLFETAEGVKAIEIGWPIVTASGDYLGFVSVIFEPASLLSKAVDAVPEARGGQYYLAQSDGVVLCGSVPAQGAGRTLSISLHGTEWRLGPASGN